MNFGVTIERNSSSLFLLQDDDKVQLQQDLEVAENCMRNGDFDQAFERFGQVVNVCLSEVDKDSIILQQATRGMKLARFEMLNLIATGTEDVATEAILAGGKEDKENYPFLVSDGVRPSTRAKHQLGRMFFEGDHDIRKDEQKGCQYLEEAAVEKFEPATVTLTEYANKGSESAINSLINLASKGLESAKNFLKNVIGVREKPESAQALFSLAQKSESAIKFIADQAYEKSLSAMPLLEQLADENCQLAAFHSGVLHALNKNTEMAKKYFDKLQESTINAVETSADNGSCRDAKGLAVMYELKYDGCYYDFGNKFLKGKTKYTNLAKELSSISADTKTEKTHRTSNLNVSNETSRLTMTNNPTYQTISTEYSDSTLAHQMKDTQNRQRYTRDTDKIIDRVNVGLHEFANKANQGKSVHEKIDGETGELKKLVRKSEAPVGQAIGKFNSLMNNIY